MGVKYIRPGEAAELRTFCPYPVQKIPYGYVPGVFLFQEIRDGLPQLDSTVSLAD